MKGLAMTRKEAERQKAIDRLRGLLNPGDTVYTVLCHCSRSGMSRSINLYTFHVADNGKIQKQWLSYWAAKALSWAFDAKRGAVRVGGCGMDTGFHLVYSLASTIFHDDPRKTETDRSCGYWLKQEWL